MASGLYNTYFYQLALGDYHWDTDDNQLALLGDSYTFDADHTQWTSSTGPGIYEIPAADGYTSGGTTMANEAVTQGTDLAKLDADDTAWTGATITAYGAVIYNNTLSSDNLCAYFDFAAAKECSTGSFTLQWSTDGIMTIAEST